LRYLSLEFFVVLAEAVEYIMDRFVFEEVRSFGNDYLLLELLHLSLQLALQIL
jgi:hypothetical protein